MAGITVSASDLENLLGISLPEDRFEILKAHVLRKIRTAYRPDPELAEGYAAEVLNGVFTDVATRVATNPGGARSLGIAGRQQRLGKGLP